MVASDEPAKGVFARRIDVPCKRVGFDAPPGHIHLKLYPAKAETKAIILTPAGLVAQVGAWLSEHCRAALHIPKAVGSRVLRADIEVLPEAWQRLTAVPGLHHIDLTPDGTASLFLDCNDDEAKALVRHLSIDAEPARTRLDLSGPTRLTAHQFDVLATAVALGYYDIPHVVDLRMLAQKVGASLGTTAQVLRRAEAKVLQGHVDRESQQRWDDAGKQQQAP